MFALQLTWILLLGQVHDVDGPAVDDEVPHAADEAQLEAGAPDHRREPERFDVRVDPAHEEGAGQI